MSYSSAAANSLMASHDVRSRATIDRPQVSAQAPVEHELLQVIGHIQKELRTLEERRTTIAKRIAMIKQTIASLGTLVGPNVIDERLEELLAPRRSPKYRSRGITNCCRQLLSSGRSNPLTLGEILDAFREQYPEVLATQKHPATSLRTVLKRLVMYGEAVEARPRNGLLTWQATSKTALGQNLADPERMTKFQK